MLYYRPLSIVATRCSYRHFTSSSRLAANRYYRYAVDVHGQLFLHDTTPKNLTSCFKNPQFLDFFFARVKRNDAVASEEKTSEEDAKILSDPEWTEKEGLKEDKAMKLALLDGYHWISPCQGELNFIRAEESPVVFRELDDDGESALSGPQTGSDQMSTGTLRWAGSYTMPFDASALRVDPDTGYVFHPSPIPPLKSAQRKVEEGGVESNPLGPYSLLSSGLVLQKLASELDIDPAAFSQGKGGSIEWKGKRYEMGILTQEDRR